MGVLSTIFGKGAKELTDSLGNAINGLSTSDEEKLILKNKISTIVLDALNKLAELQASIINTEAKGNWIQRSWRPITMLTFVAIIVLGAFIEIPYLKEDSKFWDLLEIGLGGYVIGRTTEKVADKVTKNIDLSFLRKKDRKI